MRTPHPINFQQTQAWQLQGMNKMRRPKEKLEHVSFMLNKINFVDFLFKSFYFKKRIFVYSSPYAYFT